MSAASTVVFFGLRFELVTDDEIDDVQLRTDQRVRRARAHRLDHHDGRFSDGNDVRDQLLIGKKLATSGYDSPMPIEFDQQQLAAVFTETREKLVAAGWHDEPRLMVLFDPDQ